MTRISLDIDLSNPLTGLLKALTVSKGLQGPTGPQGPQGAAGEPDMDLLDNLTRGVDSNGEYLLDLGNRMVEAETRITRIIDFLVEDEEEGAETTEEGSDGNN